MKPKKIIEYGNPIFTSGNWIVTEKGIYWLKEQPTIYFLDKDSFHQSRNDEHGDRYDTMLNVAQKTWITESDLQNFNHAFIFALGYFKKLPLLSFAETLIEQKSIFKDTQKKTDFLGNDIVDDEILL